jgi:hypothetical protein
MVGCRHLQSPCPRPAIASHSRSIAPYRIIASCTYLVCMHLFLCAFFRPCNFIIKLASFFGAFLGDGYNFFGAERRWYCSPARMKRLIIILRFWSIDKMFPEERRVLTPRFTMGRGGYISIRIFCYAAFSHSVHYWRVGEPLYH